MRVLMVASHINYSLRGGLSRHTYELSKALRNLGCQVTVMTMDRKENRVADFRGTSFVPCIGCKPFDLISFNLNMLRKARGFEADVVHSQSGHGFVFALCKRKPLVATAHGSPKIVMRTSSMYKHHLSPYITLACDTYTFRSADRVIAVSDSIRRFLRDECGVKNEKIAVIHNGVDTEKFNPKLDPNFVRRKWSISGLLLICVTRIGHDRFAERLIPTMKDVWKELPETSLIIVGDGPLRKELEILVQRQGIAEKVIFAGRKYDTELPFFYAAADLCILPMVYPAATKELTVLESLASGKVFVGIKRGRRSSPDEDDRVDGNPILVSNERDFVDNIIHLLQSSRKRRRLGLAGRRLVSKKFAWERIAENTLQQYKSIVD